VLSLVAGVVSAVQLAVSPRVSPARAAVTTGTAGLFVPTQGSVLDTRTGLGGISGPVAANTWYPVQVAGQAGVPASGVSAVQVSVTVLTPTSTGLVKVAANGTAVVPIAALTYTGGGGSISASSITALADGKIQVLAQTSVTLLVHVQGYYTAGNGSPAPGGYVPVNPARMVDTRIGTGLPQAKLATGSTTAVSVGGLNNVPADASAVFVMLTAISTSSTAGYLSPYPTGTTRPPNVSLNYLANTATILGAAVDLGAGGQFNLWVGPAGTAIDVIVDVVGYYTATPGTKGAFTPASTRAYDSRTAPSTQLAANSSRRVQVGGVAGVPLPGSGISALAVSAQIVHSGTHAGYLALGPGDQRFPVAASVYFSAGSNVRSSLAIVPTAGDGTVLLVNSSADPVHVILDVEGWYSAVGSAIPAGQSRTQQYLTLQADPSGGGAWVTYQYRAGVTGGWTDVPTSDVTIPGTTTHPASWPVVKSGSPAVFAPYTWDVGATLNQGDQLVQVQACFGSSASDPSPVCSMASTVQLATHAFGDSYATDAVGPGSLSLLTGDYQVSAADVSVPTYQGSLSIGRSLTSLAPAGERAGASGVFGPGWTASLPGAEAGAADLALVDHSSDGYLSFTGSDGSVSLYQATSPTSSYPVSYAGVDEAAVDGATVTKLSATEVRLLDADGTTTVFALNATTHLGTASSVIESGSASTTTFTRDAAGRVTRILGAVPAGVSCASPDTTPACRSLTLTYGSVPVSAGTVSRLRSVVFHTFDPATAAMTAVSVAAYDYDSAGQLAAAYDPRISPNLRTTYTYDGNGRLATLTPPGLAPWTMTYDGNGRLSAVSRYDAALAQTATSTVVYGVPFTGSGAPIELGVTATAAWGQTSDLPAVATAVFGPDRVPAGAPTAADWPYAELHYLDANGRETNTAAYGAGAWQYGATSYDANGNTVSSLTPGNRAQALNPTADTDPAVAALTSPAARAALLSSSQVYDPLYPERLTDSYGPAHPVVLADGSTIDGRSHQHTTYDQGAPVDASGNPSPGLPTTVTSAAWDIATGIDRDSVTVKTGFSAVAAGATKSGWDLGQATSSTTVGAGTGGTDLVSNSRYNDAGQTVQSWLPASTGNDARSTSTSYYTATGTGPCVSAALTGLTCSTGPTAQPTTGHPLPVTTTSYNRYDQPLTVTETAGSTVRTTTTSYDDAGRPTGSTMTVTPTAAGGTALPAVTTSYDTTNGLPTTTTAGGKTLTTDYDSLGRAFRYTDATSTVSTRTYDIRGLVTSLYDGKGTYRYSYDSASEHRGLITAEDLGVDSTPDTFTAAYNADGNLATQGYPNGLTATRRFNNAGSVTALDYTKDATAWMSFTQSPNAQGGIARQSSPESSQVFRYDPARRLIQTQDSSVGSSGTCTTRRYTLDANSNRTQLRSFPGSSGCTTSTTPTTLDSTVDQADRLANAGYTYDTLGRTTTVPASDAQGIGSNAATTGALSFGYYSNDMVASQSQGGRTLSFTLDPTRTRFVDTTDSAGDTATNHYIGSGDSPAWTSTGSGSWIRNLRGIDGTFAATADQSGTVILQLPDMRGNIVATAAADVTASNVTSYFESTEFGAPRNPTLSPTTYGWLGAAQRSTNSLGGMSLMGVRVYNPGTGRFTSTDPVAGGSANAYDYANQDPLNNLDLNGQWYYTWSSWTNRYGCTWFGCAVTVRRVSFRGYWNRSETAQISHFGTAATSVPAIFASARMVAGLAASRVVGALAGIGAYISFVATLARMRNACLGVAVETAGVVPWAYTFNHGGSRC
jgi:RHS repeat-associated protein